MQEETVKRDRFDWRFPFYAAAAALVLFVPIIIYGIGSVAEILYIFLALPVISAILLIIAFRKKGLRRVSVLSMLVVYWAASLSLFMNFSELRTRTRWLLWSRDYKAKVLAQPVSASGALRHIEWDGWGGFGAGDTVEYLVFDPNDSLLTAAKSHSPGKFSGIPCEVVRVRRLDSQYYSVLFYTDTDWDRCN